MLLLVAACGAAPTPVQQADVAAWTADDGICVQSSSTRAQADDCLAAATEAGLARVRLGNRQLLQ